MQETHRTAGHALRAVIFDMDNTLFEFVDAQMEACGAVIDRLGAGSEADLFALFTSGQHGFECYENISDYMQRLGIHDEGTFFDCCEAYEETKLESIVVYSGIRESLEELKRMGLLLAVVTDASSIMAVARLERTGLRRFFDVVVSSEEAGQSKPDPASVRLALERLGVRAEEALLVGDSLHRDLAAAKALGVRTAYASYGDKSYAGRGNGGVDCVLASPEEIVGIASRRIKRA